MTCLRTILVSCFLLPGSALASRYSGLAESLEDATGETGLMIVRWACLMLGVVLAGLAIIDPDFVHEDEDPNQPGFMGFVLRTFGRKGVRVTWALGALLIGSIWLNTRADVSAETEVSDVTCGSPGTNSYLDSEGFCDCKAGYTWVNESDPNSVHCVAVK